MRTYKRIACVKNISNHFNPQINIFKGKLLISATHIFYIFSDKVIYFRSAYKQQSKPLKKCLSIKYILKHSKNKTTTTTTTTLLLLLSRGVGYFMGAVTENGFNVP